MTKQSVFYREVGARQEREEIRLEIQRMKFDIEREIQRKDMLRNKGMHDTLTRAEAKINQLTVIEDLLKQREREGA